MHYNDIHGNPAEGDLWSPGPKMSTVWVLTTSAPAVVDTRTMTETHYTAPDLGRPHTRKDVTAAHKVLDHCPASGWPRRYEPRDAAEATAVAHAQTVLAAQAAFTADQYKRVERRSQRAPLSKAAWAKLVATHLDEFAVPNLFGAAQLIAA